MKSQNIYEVIDIDMKKLLAAHDIIFKEQPKSYREALPFGNGKFGGMVYKPSYWEWVVSKLDVDNDMWKDYMQDKCSPLFMYAMKWVETSQPYSEHLKAVKNKDRITLDKIRKKETDEFMSKNKVKPNLHVPKGIRNNIVPAFLRIYTSVKSGESFVERLDLYHGTITAQIEENDKGYCIKTVCDSESDVFLVELSSSEKKLPVEKIVLARPMHDCFSQTKPQFGYSGNCIWVDFKFANHFHYVVLARIVGASFEVDILSEEISAVLKNLSGELLVYVTCSTCLETEDPKGKCMELVSDANKKQIKARNQKHWKKYWSKSAIMIDDDFMENVYYFNQYAFECTCGVGMQAKYKAAGLYGLWTHTDNTIWSNRPYSDVNIEVTYQQVFSSNHLEQFGAFVDMVWAFLPIAGKHARKNYKLPGVCFPCGNFHCVGPWYCALLWDYYTYSQDIDYLKLKAYPIMKAVGEFYASFLEKDQRGKYFLFGSCPPEHGFFTADQTKPEIMGFDGFYKNVAIDLIFLKHLYKNLIKASKILRLNPDMIVKCEEILANFPDYPKGLTKYGETIFDMEEDETPLMCHHPNTIASIYPTREFHFSSKKKEASLGEATLRSCWDNLSMRYTFASPWVAVAMARMGLADEADIILSKWIIDLLTDSSGFLGREIGTYFVPYNGMFLGHRRGNPPLLETGCGFINAVNEMLVQEQEGKLFVFPALPSRWRRASFQNLRIPGAFCVSGHFENDEILAVKILSLKGGKISLFNPWPDKKIVITSTAHASSHSIANGYIKLTLQPEECLTLKSTKEISRRSLCKHTVKRPKDHISVQGYHVFLGKDKTSRIIEAVNQFSFPIMSFSRGAVSVMDGYRHSRFVEIQKNLFFKFDFGTKKVLNYSKYFNNQHFGNVPFCPVSEKSIYDNIKRYGWEETKNIKCISLKSNEPLTKTAIKGQKPSRFVMLLNKGKYQFLLLHGNGEKIRTKINFPQLGSHFCFNAPDGKVGIEGFGINVPSEQKIEMVLTTAQGYHWQINAILVKKVW